MIKPQEREPVGLERLAGSLKDFLKGKVVLVGLGNPLKGDDAIGPELVNRLSGRIHAVCIDAGSTLENHLGRIAREDPNAVLLIDAAHLGLPAGQCELLCRDAIALCGLTTHDISPAHVMALLEQVTHADIRLLAVQPQDLTIGAPLTPPVDAALTAIERLLLVALPKPTQE